MNKLLLIVPALFIAGAAIAQEEADFSAPETKEVKHLLKMVPQEFIVNTFRLDYEFKTGTRSSLQISPSFTSVDYRYNEGTAGGGADLTAKFYLREENYSLKGFYGGINASFHQFRIRDHYTRRHPVVGTQWGEQENNVSRIGGNLVLGYQFLIKGVVAIDLYAGGGIRASRTKEETTSEYYSYDFTDPRYSGIAPKAGVSIGVKL